MYTSCECASWVSLYRYCESFGHYVSSGTVVPGVGERGDPVEVECSGCSVSESELSDVRVYYVAVYGYETCGDSVVGRERTWVCGVERGFLSPSVAYNVRYRVSPSTD